jgi:malonyl-CoA decarboxylase
MGASFFQKTLDNIADRSRHLRNWNGRKSSTKRTETIDTLARALLSGRGEASGVALARQVLDVYAGLTMAERIEFFRVLARDFGPDQQRLRAAWSDYDRAPTSKNLQHLLRIVEPPRQELFRRLNLAPGGTSALVALRQDLLDHVASDPELVGVDNDLVHLLYSWFNRGFLTMQRITWSSPADILEQIIRYEAVHKIEGWDDLRRRIQPPDRRCYAFFHPSLVDEPLIFVAVALTKQIPSSIQEILADERQAPAAEQATTAVFYSISNCQPGLRGISFGNFLIKQVVEDLSGDLPSLKTFVTLSPAPGFGPWLKRVAENPAEAALEGIDTAPLALLDDPNWHQEPAVAERLRPLLMCLAAAYYLRVKTKNGQPLDPVARFHLGNGARLERLNWLGDTSAKGLREAAGLMVNYLYDLNTIEANHESYANQGTVAASPAIHRRLDKLAPKTGREDQHV